MDIVHLIKKKSKLCVSFASMVCNINLALAFTSEYKSDQIYPPPKPPNPYDARLISNAPYSLCFLDGLHEQDCKKIGLNLWGDTFAKYNLYEDFYVRTGYEKKTRQVSLYLVQEIVDTYNAFPWAKKTFDVPTEGQLVWLINNGYIDGGGSGTAHFVRQGTGNSIRTATIDRGYSDTPKARLTRLVTKAVEDSCQDANCEMFQNRSPYWMVFFSNCSQSWNWRIEAIQDDGTPKKFSIYGEGKLYVTNRFREIDVGMRNMKFGYAWRKDVQLTDRLTWTDHECYQLGSCTGYTIKNGWTEQQCRDRFNKTKKEYNVEGKCTNCK